MYPIEKQRLALFSLDIAFDVGTSYIVSSRRQTEAFDAEGEAMRLKGKVAVVTGGSRGIGRAIALALAEEGADVAINYQRNEALAREVAQALERLGRAADIYQADVSDPAQVLRMRDAILKRFDHVDILVNNAGINRDKSFTKMDHETWKSVLSVNL